MAIPPVGIKINPYLNIYHGKNEKSKKIIKMGGYRREKDRREKRLDFFWRLCVDRPSREAKRGYFLPERIPLFFAPS
jgi:hypothetical protein